MVSVEPPVLAPAPLSLLSSPPHAANASASSAAASAPTILLCMSPLPGLVKQTGSVLCPRQGWQAIQAGLNGPDAELHGGRPGADAFCLLTAVGGGRELADAAGPGGRRRSRALYPCQRTTTGRLRRSRRVAVAGPPARLHPGLPDTASGRGAAVDRGRVRAAARDTRRARAHGGRPRVPRAAGLGARPSRGSPGRVLAARAGARVASGPGAARARGLRARAPA